MKIIRKGVIPSEKEHECMCSKCKSIFTFTEREAQLRSDQRDGDFFELNCPVCGNKIYKDART